MISVPAEMTPLEIGTGTVFGFVAEAPYRHPSSESPRSALEAIVLEALQRPPCLITFSGGLDSSTILAVAAAVARKEGLDLPIPLTWRFPQSAGTEESGYQEQVMKLVDVPDWVIEHPGESVDILGEQSRKFLRRYGTVFPFNLFAHVPAFERASGGSLLTGMGGDEILAAQKYQRAAQLLTGRSRPSARTVRSALVALSPRFVRRDRARRNVTMRLPWLTSEAQDRVRRTIAVMAPSELWYHRNVAHVSRLRYLHYARARFEEVGRDYDVTVDHPLANPRFANAVATAGGRRGFGGRGRALEEIVGELLPTAVLERRSKATFNSIFWRPSTTEAASHLPVEELDSTVFDRDALRAEWRRENPSARSYLLAQHLASRQRP